MNVSATIPVVLFVLLMAGCMLSSYAIAVQRGDVQAWIPYISDTGLRGPEHFVFAQLLNVAAFVGVVMILQRFIAVVRHTDDHCIKVLNTCSLFPGLLATVSLSFVANFPEGQSHGVGIMHEVGAGIVFTGGCVFIVCDTIVTLRMRYMQIIYIDPPGDPQQRHWSRSLRWFEWIQLILAVLSVIAWILSITGKTLSTNTLASRAGNATAIIPHFWHPHEHGYDMHVQGAVCEWLMGIFFVVYSLLLLPEFRKFTIHIKLEPVDHNELGPPREHTPLLL